MGGGSSSSSLGWGGGGSSVTILNTTDLVSQREGKRSEVDETLTVLRDVNRQYGLTIDTDVATLKEPNVMAYYQRGGNIGVNKTYFDSAKMDEAYDRCVARGFHPSKGNKTGMEATVAHETGHALTMQASQKMGYGFDQTAGRIVTQAKKKAGFKGRGSDMARRISGYAGQSASEAIAEAFSDVYCNGRRAKKESRAIVDTLNEIIGG